MYSLCILESMFHLNLKHFNMSPKKFFGLNIWKQMFKARKQKNIENCDFYSQLEFCKSFPLGPTDINIVHIVCKSMGFKNNREGAHRKLKWNKLQRNNNNRKKRFIATLTVDEPTYRGETPPMYGNQNSKENPQNAWSSPQISSCSLHPQPF